MPIHGRISGQPWVDHIEWSATDHWLRQLQIACFIVIDYLSGMRPQEALGLRRGCAAPIEGDPDGVRRYELRGREFKGMVDERGNQLVAGRERRHPWTVVKPVADAVAVCERVVLADDLFALLGDRRVPHMGTLLTSGAINRWVAPVHGNVQQAGGHAARPEERIPDDPAGPVTARRFRRTLAWFISRQPGGTVALGVQYGHVRLLVSEGYGARSHGLADLLDIEESRMVADTLHRVADGLKAGERVSGPAAGRLGAAAAEFEERFGGRALTERQYRALRRHSPLRVFDNPGQFLVCNYDPHRALCAKTTDNEISVQTPARENCQPACANIARTDTHIRGLRERIRTLRDQSTSGLLPEPMRARLHQRIARLEAIVDEHEAGGHDAR